MHTPRQKTASQYPHISITKTRGQKFSALFITLVFAFETLDRAIRHGGNIYDGEGIFYRDPYIK